MQKKRHLSSLFTCLALLLLAHGAQAIGWSRSAQTAVLGQPLDFVAALRLDPGDVIAPECVTAEVMVGEQRLPSSSVRVLVDAGSSDALVMRVVSSSSVDEPVVTVTLAIGCPARMSRRFVLLADPPATYTPAVALALPAAEPATAVNVAPAPAAPVRAMPTVPEPSTAARQVARSDSEGPRPPPAAKKKLRKAPPSPVQETRVAPRAETKSRLKLDPAEPVAAAPAPAAAASAVDEAMQVVALAASAARAAASAASAAEARIASLERTVSDLRAESKANRDLMAQMRDRLGAADGDSRWTMPLVATLLGLLALSVWLGWRLRLMQKERLAIWRRAAAAEQAGRPATPTSQLPMVTSEIMVPTVPPTVPSWVSPGGPSTPTFRPERAPPPPPSTLSPAPTLAQDPRPGRAESDYERTDVLTAQVAMPGVGSPRDVSIEELLDLEQQAEFFIVLGQEDAAVELLVDHLRNTGGGSPLPYLKLLEIYHRRNEREAYERTRTRFNHRFNAYAPGWEVDLQHGRSLDDYPGVIPRLQQVWPRPLDAMAELEALLFRKSRGELFDLPAYREVLFLYSLARDLLDREAADSGNVDLLLPLADGGEFSATSPHPYFGHERDSVFDSLAEDRSTLPVDLDLTQPDTPSVIVDAQIPRF
jgi:hypothetical protein